MADETSRVKLFENRQNYHAMFICCVVNSLKPLSFEEHKKGNGQTDGSSWSESDRALPWPKAQGSNFMFTGILYSSGIRSHVSCWRRDQTSTTAQYL